MRVVLPVRNQKANQNSSTNASEPSGSDPGKSPPDSTTPEVARLRESPTAELSSGLPQIHSTLSAPVFQSETASSIREDLYEAIEDPGSAAALRKRCPDLEQDPEVTASTFKSNEGTTPERLSRVVWDKEKKLNTLKSEPAGTGVERNRKRNVISETTTGLSENYLDRKPSAAEIPFIKKQRQILIPRSGLGDTQRTRSRMVEGKLPSQARRRSSFDENSRESIEDPTDLSNESCSADDDENNPASAIEDYSQFDLALKKRGLEIKSQEGDGNCLFRAVSLQIYGDASSHGEIRKRCLDFMARDEAHFSQFVTGEPFQDYIRRKRHDGVHGNNPELQAISELFNRPVEVFVPENGAQPLNIFHAEYKTDDAPIRLSYHDGNHYNAVIDPLCPTAGLGLGLPGLEPGLADRMQVARAVEESDKLADEAELEKAREASHNDQLQRAIKESTQSVHLMYKEKAMALSDLEATEIEMEQAALVSSLESYQHGELGRKQAWSGSGGRHQSQGSPQNSSRIPSVGSGPIPGLPSRGTASVASSDYAVAQPHASASVAAAAVAHEDHDFPKSHPMQPHDEYPPTIQELVMNGFELSKVLHAYDLIGDNFDDLLAFLMSSTR